MCYVLDEPTIGLHARDNQRLLDTLEQLKDRGNTLVVVEHDEDTIRSADWVVDLGEGAGTRGGRLMYEGPPESMDGSLTGRYLRGELAIPVPERRRESERALRIVGAQARNLRTIDVTIPLGHRCMGVLPTKSKTVVDPLQVHGLVLLGPVEPIVRSASARVWYTTTGAVSVDP